MLIQKSSTWYVLRKNQTYLAREDVEEVAKSNSAMFDPNLLGELGGRCYGLRL